MVHDERRTRHLCSSSWVAGESSPRRSDQAQDSGRDPRTRHLLVVCSPRAHHPPRPRQRASVRLLRAHEVRSRRGDRELFELRQFELFRLLALHHVRGARHHRPCRQPGLPTRVTPTRAYREGGCLPSRWQPETRSENPFQCIALQYVSRCDGTQYHRCQWCELCSTPQKTKGPTPARAGPSVAVHEPGRLTRDRARCMCSCRSRPVLIRGRSAVLNELPHEGNDRHQNAHHRQPDLRRLCAGPLPAGLLQIGTHPRLPSLSTGTLAAPETEELG